jgi:predicted transcriptional regulator
MSQELVPISSTQHTRTLGERVRKIADKLREETDLQIKVTSRILGAAAKISENHEHLIDEVVDMVEDDLAQNVDTYTTNTYTVEALKKKFKTLGEAKQYFDLKANSWLALAEKLNRYSNQQIMSAEIPKMLIIERLDVIENELKVLRLETSQILALVQQLIFK